MTNATTKSARVGSDADPLATKTPPRVSGESAPAVIDRKYVQKVKAAHEQRERSLARAVMTALATCGTLVGWMLFAKPTTAAVQAPVPPLLPTETAVPAPPTAIMQAVSSAPIPTIVALPTFVPVPTLMKVNDVVAAPVQVIVAQPTAVAPDQGASAPQVVSNDVLPALRVVTMPTAMPARPPRPGQPNPANPNPNPGGNTGGSK